MPDKLHSFVRVGGWRKKHASLASGMFFSRCFLGILLAAVGPWTVLQPETRAGDVTAAVQLARQYLLSDDAGERRALSAKLAPFDKHWPRVLAALRMQPQQDVQPGYYAEERFTSPRLRKKHPDDLLYFIVPQSYQPERATGLVVFMHGGGKGSPRTSPARYMRPDKPSAAYIGDIFEQTGMIGVAPSAPWNPDDHSRWTLPETDDYLADVVAECKTRFHVDPHRVILWGHSMGGFGGFHQVQRQPDRFAAIIASAGSWTLAQWPVIRGTTFCIVHGVKDAERGVRDRHTDIQFARQAHTLLSELKIPHVFMEHAGAHPVAEAKAPVLDFLQTHAELRRNPFPRQVAVASPVGFRAEKCFPKTHSYWLSLNEAFPNSELEYDALTVPRRGYSKDSSADDWRQWKLTRGKEKRPGAMIEAANLGGNRFEIETSGVSRFTLWLHPRMIDFKKPVAITLNGVKRTEQPAAPSLATLLDSWELVYPAKIVVRVPE